MLITGILIETLRRLAPTGKALGKLVCHLILSTIAPPNLSAAWVELGAHKISRSRDLDQLCQTLKTVLLPVPYALFTHTVP